MYTDYDLLEHRYWRVIDCICRRGMNARETAAHCGYSINTVYQMLSTIYRVLGLEDIDDLRRWYVNNVGY